MIYTDKVSEVNVYVKFAQRWWHLFIMKCQIKITKTVEGNELRMNEIENGMAWMPKSRSAPHRIHTWMIMYIRLLEMSEEELRKEWNVKVKFRFRRHCEGEKAIRERFTLGWEDAEREHRRRSAGRRVFRKAEAVWRKDSLVITRRDSTGGRARSNNGRRSSRTVMF